MPVLLSVATSMAVCSGRFVLRNTKSVTSRSRKCDYGCHQQSHQYPPVVCVSASHVPWFVEVLITFMTQRPLCASLGYLVLTSSVRACRPILSKLLSASHAITCSNCMCVREGMPSRAIITITCHQLMSIRHMSAFFHHEPRQAILHADSSDLLHSAKHNK